MKTLNQTSLLTGAFAGVTAALLSLGANAPSVGGLLLVACAPLPILVAGLGWGNAAALAAVAIAGLGLASFSSVADASLSIMLSFAPAAWLSHISNLARPASELGGPDHALAWYPLSDILTQIVLLGTATMIVLGVVFGYNNALVSVAVDQLVAAMKTQDTPFDLTPTSVERMKSSLYIGIPMALGSSYVMTMFATHYVASRIAQLSGKSLRPREDMPSTLRMHRLSIFAFLAGLLLAFMGGLASAIGMLICGAFGAGFVLAGFAVFHFRTRGKAWRLPVLWFGYMSVVLFTIPAFFFLLSGLMDTRRAIALSPAGKTTETDTKEL